MEKRSCENGNVPWEQCTYDSWNANKRKQEYADRAARHDLLYSKYVAAYKELIIDYYNFLYSLRHYASIDDTSFAKLKKEKEAELSKLRRKVDLIEQELRNALRAATHEEKRLYDAAVAAARGEYDALIAELMKTIQEQLAKIQKNKAKIAEIEEEINKYRRLIANFPKPKYVYARQTENDFLGFNFNLDFGRL